MITARTARRLSQLAPTNLIVGIRQQQTPRRRWFSVGLKRAGEWHQIYGSIYANDIEKYLAEYGYPHGQNTVNKL